MSEPKPRPVMPFARPERFPAPLEPRAAFGLLRVHPRRWQFAEPRADWIPGEKRLQGGPSTACSTRIM